MFMLASGVLLAVAYSALSPLWKPAATPAGPTPPAAEPPAHAGRQRASAQLPRVTVTVLFREESRTMEFQRPVTAEAIVQGLFPQERAAGYRVRIISGGGAREGAEVLLPQEDDTLTVHAVVSGGVGAPPSPAPAPATAQGGGGGWPPSPGQLLALVMATFLACVWGLLLVNPSLVDLPSRVMLGLLTLGLVALRPT